MDWLDHHSGSLTAIATAVLAVITFIYVLLTRSLATSSRDAITQAQHANRLTTEANLLSRQAIELELDERLRRQASKIVAWVTPGHMAYDGRLWAVVEFKNASDGPVWDCFFKVVLKGAEYQGLRALIEPETEGTQHVAIAVQPDDGERAELGFDFTDNAGVRWRREPNGALSRVS